MPAIGCAKPAAADDAGLAAPLVLAPGELRLAAAVEAASDDAGQPVALAADAWYGLGPQLTLGLHHSHRPLATIGATRGLCIHDCADRYGGIAAAAHIPVTSSSRTRLIGTAAVDAVGFSPARVAVELGAIAAWRQDRLWARAQPRLALGVLGRAIGNRDTINLGFAVGAALGATVGVELGAGVAGPATGDFAGDLRAPLWTQVVLRPRPWLGLGAAIGHDNIFDRATGRVHAALTVEVRAAS